MPRHTYEIIVGNIGQVHTGTNMSQALQVYNVYVDLSQRLYGRASGEDVTMFKDGEVYKEYTSHDAARITCVNICTQGVQAIERMIPKIYLNALSDDQLAELRRRLTTMLGDILADIIVPPAN